MREVSKDIQLGERKFRVDKMSAMSASWIVNVLLATMVNLKQVEQGEQPVDDTPPAERASQAVIALWLVSSTNLAPDTYEKIQRLCLCSCYAYEKEDLVSRIMSSDGKWVYKDLEQDGLTVNKLVQECLKFNLSPFFIESASSLQAAV